MPAVGDDELLAVLHATVDAVAAALATLPDWGLAGTHPGQHYSDLAADAAATAVLEAAGLGILSEESGGLLEGRTLVVVVDPVDGSTNAAQGIPWYATSLCALDADGPRAAVVANQASGARFEAVRGGGARVDGRPLRPSACASLSDAVVSLNDHPAAHLGWRQYRCLGATALDLCAVAAGVLDAHVDCADDACGPWDFLGGVLMCAEAGAAVADAFGRDLVARGHADRRTPVAAATPALLDQALAARQGLGRRGR